MSDSSIFIRKNEGRKGPRMKAYLILEDGTVFEGKRIGSDRDVVCEVVFNTAMAGYLEVLTDPSYAGQGVTMTYPLMGNYGINEEDAESRRPWASAFIVQTVARRASNYRSEEELDRYLKRWDIPGIAGLDTRALTRHLRSQGTMNGMITSGEGQSIQACAKIARAYSVTGVVKMVSRPQPEHFAGTGYKVALMDYGAKNSIIKSLCRRGCDVTVFPQDTPASDVLAIHPDGVMLSNGPGDPKECTGPIACVRELYDSGIPIFGICLGHQITALAMGADTEKLDYGHRGVNHPVKELATGRVYITSQNHGYVVRGETIPNFAKVSYVNVNDGTIEGVTYDGGRVYTVQFHPEASPGPVDTNFLFDRFINVMGGKRDA